ncbi:hypothetical protein [Photobacterium sp. 53610]|uniref:hypothetical protein n=1 Tax=Photobacterium sp. 53610 TaxID=3102789 RepID=UPI002EDB6C9E
MNRNVKILLAFILLLTSCGIIAASNCPVNIGVQMNEYVKYDKLTEMSLLDVRDRYKLKSFTFEGEKLQLPINEQAKLKLESSLSAGNEFYLVEDFGSLWIVDFQKMFYFCNFDEFNWASFLDLVVTKSSNDDVLKQIASHIRLALSGNYELIIPKDSDFIIYDSGGKIAIVYITIDSKMIVFNNFQ